VLPSDSLLIATRLIDELCEMKDDFPINDSYYGADHVRRQYDWEECLHDWLNVQFIVIKTSILRSKIVDLIGY